MANDSSVPPTDAVREQAGHRITSEREPFVMVPTWILPLGQRAVATYTVLMSFADNDGTNCFPALDTIAKRGGCSRNTIRAGIADLEAAGAVVVTPHKVAGLDRPSSYHLVGNRGSDIDHRGSIEPAPRLSDSDPNLEVRTDLEVKPTVSHAEKPARPEVAELCALLADHVGAVTGARPVVSKAWERDMRLTLDQPRAPGAEPWTAEQVEYVIGWLGRAGDRSQFWSVNVRCPSKLRAQMDRLVLEIRAERRTGSSPSSRIERIREAAAGPPDEGILARTMREQRERNEAARLATAEREQKLLATLGAGS